VAHMHYSSYHAPYNIGNKSTTCSLRK